MSRSFAISPKGCLHDSARKRLRVRLWSKRGNTGLFRDPVIADAEALQIARTSGIRKLRRSDRARIDWPVCAVSPAELVRIPRIAPLQVGHNIGQNGLDPVISCACPERQLPAVSCRSPPGARTVAPRTCRTNARVAEMTANPRRPAISLGRQTTCGTSAHFRKTGHRLAAHETKPILPFPAPGAWVSDTGFGVFRLCGREWQRRALHATV